MSSVRLAVIGDSFAEGMGDELPGDVIRGWGDLLAQGWANGIQENVLYANFAIRGKLAWQVVEEQLEPALALKPTHLAFNAGGNDMIRRRADIEHVADAFSRALRRCDEEGVQIISLSSANPTAQLPLGGMIQRRGDALTSAVDRRIRDRRDVVRVANWPDRALSHPVYWAADRLHLNANGHHRVAARALRALGVPVAENWWTPQAIFEPGLTGPAYYVAHVGPWLKRRLTGRSSGDGRSAKHPEWVERVPE